MPAALGLWKGEHTAKQMRVAEERRLTEEAVVELQLISCGARKGVACDR